jgi:alginate O-acetyltransferase complex protein AlgI
LNIISPQFVIFSSAILVLYYLIPGRWQNLLLLAASYAFLLILNPEFALVFALLTAVNYWMGYLVSPGQTGSRLWLLLGVAFNIAALAYFKYADFFAPYIVYYLKRAGIVLSGDALMLLMPLGLSFYIVQAIAYLVDVYQGTFEATKKPLDFALYMVYFPRLISGPIERARSLLTQLDRPRKFNFDLLWQSLTLILTGLVRKIAIADTLLLVMPDTIFNTPENFKTPELVFWLLGYAFAIYNDFAGYTSIVRGVSAFFGIELSGNFNTPYFARNFTEFWQRWHITLSNWLRDYIYTPLTRSLMRRRHGHRHLTTVTLPPLVTMFVSALWHGASWHMLVWGGLHAFYQVCERVWMVWFKGKPPHLLSRWKQVLAAIGVFILVVLAWIPFRMDLPTAVIYIKGMLHFSDWANLTASLSLSGHLYIISLTIILISLLIDAVHARSGELVYLRLSLALKALLINSAIILIVVAIFAQAAPPPPFIYQGF